MTFATVQSVTETQQPGGGSTLTVNLPGTIDAGDCLLLLAATHHNTNATTFSTPSGWTEIAQNGSFGGVAVFAKIATGSEGSTVGISLNHTVVSGVAQVYRVTGGPDSVGDISISSVHRLQTTNPNPNQATAAWGSADNLFIVVTGYVDDDGTVTTYPTNYGNGVNTLSGNGGENGVAIGSARRELASGSDDPGAYTLSESENCGTYAIALRPTRAPGPNVPVVQSVTETQFPSGGDPINVNLPGTINSGDLLLAFVCTHHNTINSGFATPSGWTELAVRSSFGAVGVFARIADGGEGASVSFNLDHEVEAAAAQVMRITGGPASVDDIDISTVNSGQTATPDPSAVTASGGLADNLFIAFVGGVNDDATVSAYPAGYSDGVDTISGGGVDNGALVATATRGLAAATENPGPFTLSEDENCSIWALVVPPGDAAPTVTAVGDNTINDKEQDVTITGSDFGASQTGSAKVEIGSSNVYASATKVVAKVDSWSATSIQIDMQENGTGSRIEDDITPGTVYCYVTEPSGSVSAGFAFTLRGIIDAALAATDAGGDTAAFAGSVPVQGDLDASDAADVAAFSGGVLVQGDLAGIESADVAAFAGGVLIQGDLAATDAGGDTAAFAGAVPVQGNLAAEDTPDTAAFAGAVRVQGDLAAADGADVAAFAGGVLVQATLAATDAPDAADIAGSVVIQADLAAVDEPDVAAFAAVKVSYADLAATDAPDTAAFAGQIMVQGDLGATDSPDTAALAGQVWVQGDLDATDAGADVAAFAGQVLVQGDLAAEDDPDAASFAGQIPVQGDLAAAEPQDVAAFAGSVLIQADLAATDTPDVAAFTAGQSVIGDLDATDSPDVAAFEGSVIVQAVLAAVDSPDVAAFGGGVLIQGDLAGIDAPDSAALAGAVLVQAALAGVDSPDVAAILGGVLVQGALAAQDIPDTAIFSISTVSYDPSDIRTALVPPREIASVDAYPRKADVPAAPRTSRVTR